MAADGAGNLYIADTENRLIRKVDPSGVITTIAGTGTRDFGGDGGPSIEAQLNSPYDVAVDAAGNVYIADLGNDRIRILTPPPNPSAIPSVGNQLDFILSGRP